MSNKTCFFIGHRDAPQNIAFSLENAIERQITQYGMTDFVVGQYGNFDAMATQALQKAKRRFPAISLTLLLPYHPSERRVSLPQEFDNSFYPPGLETIPKRLAIIHANRYMIDHCACLISYTKYPGNTRTIVEYAKKKNVHIVHLTESPC